MTFVETWMAYGFVMVVALDTMAMAKQGGPEEQGLYGPNFRRERIPGWACRES